MKISRIHIKFCDTSDTKQVYRILDISVSHHIEIPRYQTKDAFSKIAGIAKRYQNAIPSFIRNEKMKNPVSCDTKMRYRRCDTSFIRNGLSVFVFCLFFRTDNKNLGTVGFHCPKTLSGQKIPDNASTQTFILLSGQILSGQCFGQCYRTIISLH